ncbi:MAG: 23S rRNA (adenine(2503)-C(2))-methyltransferase RlmN [Candidatus Marinimicrobia bacterium]|nr:23S rRNA (adenine(2503)-C(2))-methyltransferase RlmN [Candidatus Neomarinimicrobiota bacterium]
MEKICIKGMNHEELQTLCIKAGESKFRGGQLFEWLYRHGISSFDSMLNINKSFRQHLNEHFILHTLTVENSLPSEEDKSVKILFRTRDDHFIETVSMVENNRHTVCLSSQVGCVLDCHFCATGELGLKRNLSTGEIVDQLIYVRENTDQPITNVVFMGMGEPFHNYNNVLNASDIFHSPKGFNLASTRITISTAGLLPQINKFIKEKRRYKLAISLNASNDKVRTEIMPINKKWSINDLIKSGKEYSNQKKRLIMFEYVLLKGINDSEEDALELARLLQGIPCKINLIPYNEIEGKYQRPDETTITKFSEILHNYRDEYRVLVRWSKGQDIAAGCGQLAGRKK